MVNNNQNYNLVLEFKDGVKFCIKTENFVDRERIVSSLLTLRSFIYEKEDSDLDLVRILHNQPMDKDAKIHGY